MKGDLPTKISKGVGDVEFIPLRKVVVRTQYGVSENLSDEGGVACLRMNNLENGRIDTAELKFASLPAQVEELYLVQKNDILFNRTNSYALVGKTALLDRPIRAVFASYLIRIEPDCSKVDPRYLAQLLISETWQTRIRSLATKGVSQSNINIQNLLQLRIPVRPLPRQAEISEFLCSIDRWIEQCEKAALQVKKCKSALMQNLLSPIGITKSHYKVTCLRGLFAERKEPGEDGLPTLSVTMHDGLVDRDEHGRRVASELSPKEHLLVHKDDIAYNMMRMWQGVSGLAPYKGLVSPAYVVLRPLDGIDPLFASYLFKLPETIRLFHRYSQGLTNDRLRLYYDQFAEIKVSIPADVAEQRRIAGLLSTFDEQIEQAVNLVTSLKKTKAAICQEIFT